MTATIGIVVGLLLRSSGSNRNKQLFYVTVETPDGRMLTALMVEASGQPDKGDTIEARGGFLASNIFYTSQLLVVSSEHPITGVQLPRNITYKGKPRIPLFIPGLIMLVSIVFWILTYSSLIGIH